jgi:hypothetical protein
MDPRGPKGKVGGLDGYRSLKAINSPTRRPESRFSLIFTARYTAQYHAACKVSGPAVGVARQPRPSHAMTFVNNAARIDVKHLKSLDVGMVSAYFQF